MEAADRLQLAVVTPERAVMEEEVDEVIIRGSEGELGVLPGHVPLLTAIGIGRMTVISSGEERTFALARGFCEILESRVTVLTEYCEGVEEIDVARARAQLERHQVELDALHKEDTETLEEEAIRLHEEAMRRARNRLLLAGEEGEEH